MIRLSPRQIEALASCILGDSNEHGFEYRTHAQLDAFFEFASLRARSESDDGSRPARAVSWVRAANQDTSTGGSDLPLDVERIVVAVLDRREFGSDEAQASAGGRVNELLGGLPVEVAINQDRSVSISSTQRGRGQNILDEQIHTVFETSISDSDLRLPASTTSRRSDSSTAQRPTMRTRPRRQSRVSKRLPPR